MSKLNTLMIVGIHPHVFSQMQHLDMGPEVRVLDGGLNSILPGASNNHRQSLFDVTTPCHSDATKRNIIFQEIPQSPVNSLNNKAMLHDDFIPDDQTCLSDHLSQWIILPNVSDRSGMDVNGQIEPHVSSPPTLNEEGCNP